MFDVRFSNDSVWERFCKALQFGIMTGFAVVGPGYKTGWEPNTPAASTATNSFTTLTLILMTSRLILACQYLAVMISLRAYKKAWLPMLTHIGTMFVAAMIYLGLFFSFSKSGGENGLIAWYIVLGFEAIVIFLVSGKTKFLSFRRTAIVERLGLLTLIILGEGIIGMCGSIRKVGTDRVFNADVIGMIICSVGIICKPSPPILYHRKLTNHVDFLWMLYFDQTETERVGTMRQQFWAILHFPFHVCILLLVEGLSRLSVWRKILDIVIPFENEFFAATDISDTEEMIKALNETLDHVFSKFDESEFVLPDPTPYFDVLRDANATKSTTLDAGYNLFALGFNCAIASSTFSFLGRRSVQLTRLHSRQREFRHQALRKEPPQSRAAFRIRRGRRRPLQHRLPLLLHCRWLHTYHPRRSFLDWQTPQAERRNPLRLCQNLCWHRSGAVSFDRPPGAAEC